VKNEKARRFLQAMRKKAPIPFEQHFPRADPRALALLKRLIAFDPLDRPTAEEALADPYFAGLHSPSREPAAQPVSKLAFEVCVLCVCSLHSGWVVNPRPTQG
jgi:serine/threonine protein kinase